MWYNLKWKCQKINEYWKNGCHKKLGFEPDKILSVLGAHNPHDFVLGSAHTPLKSLLLLKCCYPFI